MTIDDIRQLAEILKVYELSKLDFRSGEGSILLERATAGAKVSAPVPLSKAEVPERAEQAIDFNKITEVRSPIVGVFYAAPAPGAEPYVKVGSRVKKGDVLCIVEAMKLMNEILAECDGEIVDICVQNGEIVEYGQVLFKIY
ncbi:MAG: acetyl-CoA carboxylase biotin carboxyl carrier protein [Eubacteriales bacterium]|jgi:acetyl-CoA carboxylase biotin carboxyl carrier protein